MAVARPWLVLREGERRRWGGDLRRRYLLDGLVERTGATAQDDWRSASIARTLRELRGPRWQLWRGRPCVGATELLPPDRLAVLASLGEPIVVDVHDEPLVQNEALGIATPETEAATIRERHRVNLEAFRFHVAPSASFAELTRMDPARTLVAPNGSDPRHVVAGSFEPRPVVGCVSAAAPGRGIETLVEAARLARADVPDLVLRLWLVPTGDASQAYLDEIRSRVAGDTWVEIGSVAYADLSNALATTRVLSVPHPPNPYMDAALPIKLFDSMASGRPLAVTPRRETAAVVEAHQAGLVAGGDTADELAGSLVAMLSDDELARRLGANARRAVETTYDWRIIGRRLADELLVRLG